MHVNFKLEDYAVPGTNEQAYYIPNFVTEQEEIILLQKINDAPKPKWKVLSNRRLQIWGGEVVSGKRLIPAKLPPFLNEFPDLIGRLRETGAFASSKHQQPNHVIVNEYLPGQGIMAHEDGPAYHPVVATVSLGGHSVFNYYRYSGSTDIDDSQKSGSRDTGGPAEKLGREPYMEPGEGRVIDPSPAHSLLLEPRSLVITTSLLYADHLHGIDPLTSDILAPAEGYQFDAIDATREDRSINNNGVRVANWSLLRDPQLHQTAVMGGVLERSTRVSLTCRDVERVMEVRNIKR